MKQVLTIILLTCLASIGFAEDSKLEEISLDKLLRDYLPNYKIEKTIKLEGIGRDFAIAKETGEITAVTHLDDDFNVYLLAKNGEIKWKKRFSEKGHETICSISDNGTSVIITNYKSIYAENTVLDNNGNILFCKKLKDIRLASTPDGEIFYEKPGIMSDREKGVYIYNRSGNETELTGFDFSDEKNIRLEFLNNKQIIAYMDTKFVFFDYYNNYLKTIWQYELTEEENIGDFFHNSILVNNDHIFISHHRLKLKTIVFSYNGKILYSENNYYGSFGYLNSKELVAYSNSISGKLLNIINLKTYKTIKINNPSIFDNINKNKYFYGAIRLDQIILYRIKRFSWDNEKYSTLITEFGCEHKNTSDYDFLINRGILKLLKKNSDKAELIFLEENYDY